MADFVFINPRTHWDIKGVTTRLPLAGLYIGSVLKEAGFSVKIIDQRVDDYWAHTLRDTLRERPLWVGIGAMTGRQIQWGLSAAQIIREIDATIPIVWGGVHPTILPEQTLTDILVDMICVGEGEMTALELTQFLRDCPDPRQWSKLDFSSIAGLVWASKGEVIHNKTRDVLDMNELPEMDYSLVNVEDYILSEVPGERSLQITTSRGCPMRCGYCYLGNVPNGRCYRAEEADRVVERIAYLASTFSVDTIHIIDDEFFTQFKRARAICQSLLDRGLDLTLRANCRIDYVIRMKDEDLALFRRAGFKHMYLGAEAGTDRILEFVTKDITVADIVEANLKLKKAGIAPKFSFMGGFPTESLEEVKATLRLMVRIVSENHDAYCSPVQLFSPYPGTALFDYSLQTGMRMPSCLAEWTNSAWEEVSYSWLSDREKKILGKIALFSFFIDGKTIAENASKWYLKLAARAYGYVVRLRVRLGFFAFMPEVRALRWEYRNIQRRKDRSRKRRYENGAGR